MLLFFWHILNCQQFIPLTYELRHQKSHEATSLSFQNKECLRVEIQQQKIQTTIYFLNARCLEQRRSNRTDRLPETFFVELIIQNHSEAALAVSAAKFQLSARAGKPASPATPAAYFSEFCREHKDCLIPAWDLALQPAGLYGLPRPDWYRKAMLKDTRSQSEWQLHLRLFVEKMQSWHEASHEIKPGKAMTGLLLFPALLSDGPYQFSYVGTNPFFMPVRFQRIQIRGKDPESKTEKKTEAAYEEVRSAEIKWLQKQKEELQQEHEQLRAISPE